MLRPSLNSAVQVLEAASELTEAAKTKIVLGGRSGMFRRRREAPQSPAASCRDGFARAPVDRSPRSGDCSRSAALRRRKSKSLARWRRWRSDSAAPAPRASRSRPEGRARRPHGTRSPRARARRCWIGRGHPRAPYRICLQLKVLRRDEPPHPCLIVSCPRRRKSVNQSQISPTLWHSRLRCALGGGLNAERRPNRMRT